MLNNYIIPLIVIVVIIYGFVKNGNIYDDFVNGVVDGIRILLKLYQ